MSQWQPNDPRRQQPATPPQWGRQEPPEDPWQASRQPSYQPVPQPHYPVRPYQPPAQPQPYAYRQPYPVQVVAPRSPAAGLIVSFFLPGVGSMMAGKTGKGIGILIGYLIGCLLCIIVIGFIVAPVFWIWGLVAAYQDAVAWNRGHGIIS